MSNNICQYCKFWENCGRMRVGVEQYKDLGECHRLPPQTVGDRTTRFPCVYADNWCGEFVPKGVH